MRWHYKEIEKRKGVRYNDCRSVTNPPTKNRKVSLLGTGGKKTASIAGCLPFFLLPRRADLIHVCPISALYKGGTLGI